MTEIIVCILESDYLERAIRLWSFYQFILMWISFYIDIILIKMQNWPSKNTLLIFTELLYISLVEF